MTTGPRPASGEKRLAVMVEALAMPALAASNSAVPTATVIREVRINTLTFSTFREI
jgi:hypothetical protein